MGKAKYFRTFKEQIEAINEASKPGGYVDPRLTGNNSKVKKTRFDIWELIKINNKNAKEV